jgi:uncharacterized protein (DUF58 family)
MSRKVGLLVGLAVIAVGFVFLAVPGVIPRLPMQYAFVALIGLLALVQGGWLVRLRWRSETSDHAPPDFEVPQSVPVPGTDLDQMLYELTHLRQGTIEYRENIRERLVEAAIDTVRQLENCSRDAAVERLQDGDWTDDPVVEAFFAGRAPSPSLRERIENYLDDRSAYERQVSRSVDAIARLANLEAAVVDDSEDEEGFSVGALADRIFRGVGLSHEPRTDQQLVEWEGDRLVYTYEDRGSYLTNRWLGVSAFSFVAFGLGLFAFEPALLVVSAVGLVYAGYARSGSPPEVSDALKVDRQFSDETPVPGEEVTVTVRVHNDGDRLLPDLRLVDAIPAPMRAAEGSPRFGTTLRPGETVTFKYAVDATRGTHSWPLYVIARNASGDGETQVTLPVESELQCVPRVETTESMSVRDLTTLFSGSIDTEIGGSGLEFHSERDYQPGDPMNRIDWSRQAKTGELATIQFRKEQSANVVLMFDTREAAYRSPAPGQPHAVDRSVDAASDVFASLFDRGDQVGLAAFDTVPLWLAPGTDDEHRERARLVLGDHPAISSVPPTDDKGAGGYIDPLTHIRRQLPNHSQLLIFSPLCDDYPADVARELDAVGHLVTVVSPDPTRTETVGQRLARIERQNRIRRLREHEINVLNWPYEQQFGLALENAKQRW